MNLLPATVDALKSLRRPEDIAQARGKTIAEVFGLSDTRRERVLEQEPEAAVEAEPVAVAAGDVPADGGEEESS